MELVLTVVSGAAWTVVYILAIRIGFKEKTYAIPVAALALNFAWETIYGIHGLLGPIDAQAVINVAWALADVVIVYTFFRYGRKEFPPFVTGPLFIGGGVLVFAVAYAVQALFISEFGWTSAPAYAAFLQNLLMSGLFIAMFISRRGARGQSLWIGVAKWLGTLAPTILFGVLRGEPFIIGIGLMCSVLDLIYIGMLLWARRNPAALAQGSDLLR